MRKASNSKFESGKLTPNKTKLKESLEKRIEESQLFSNTFGTFTKADYETLMFTVFLDCQKPNLRNYDISVHLGIPESRVRALRVRSQLLYPREIKLEVVLPEIIKKGEYDEKDNVTLTIEDPSIKNRIIDLIESNGLIVNLTLNAKQIILPAKSFLFLAACLEDNVDETIREIKNTVLRKGSVAKSLKSILNEMKEANDSIDAVLGLFNKGRSIIAALISIL